MARTLIWNTSATAQTLPAAYGGGTVQPGYGWIVDAESSVVVSAMGGFTAMHGKWAVSAISTDEALGSVDMSAAGVALIADVSASIGGGGGGGGGGPVSWADVLNKPAFATVATTGDYEDLANKPALADVATSGQYSDLAGTPSLPVASNDVATNVSATGAAGVQSAFARADHQHAHGNLAGGSLHSNATTLSAGFMSAADKAKLDELSTNADAGLYTTPILATVAVTGDYNDLGNKPAKTYDIAAYASGALSANAIVAQVIAPKALTLTGLSQTGGATVKVKVAGTDAVYPQAVSVGQVISVVVSVAGNSSTFTISAVEA